MRAGACVCVRASTYNTCIKYCARAASSSVESLHGVNMLWRIYVFVVVQAQRFANQRVVFWQSRIHTHTQTHISTATSTPCVHTHIYIMHTGTPTRYSPVARRCA